MSTSTFKYREFFNGNTVMVIVPHEDDEKCDCDDVQY